MAYELQKSFSAGELSPNVYLRNDGDFAEVFAQGLAKSRNIVPTPYGPAESRKGSQFIEKLEGETYCRLFDLDISFGESYIIAVTTNNIYVLDRNGFQKQSNIVSNSGFTGGGTDWNEDLASFIGGLCGLNPTPGQNARISQELITASPTLEHIIRVVGYEPNPEGSNPYIVKIGTTEEGSDIAEFNGTGLDNSFVFIPGVANFWITIDVPAGSELKLLDFVECFPTADSGDIVEFPSPYTVQDIQELQIEKEPGNKVMFFFTRRAAPYELLFLGTNVWSFQEITFDFGAGGSPWTGNPGCVTFYAGRMAVGGTVEEPIGVWLSKPRSYRNFDLGNGDAPDDALSLPLDKNGELVWLKGNKQLFAGLDSGEHVIFGESGIITSSNAYTEQYSTYGSSRIQSQIVNEELAYVDTRGRKVRLMNFESDSKNMNSFDISFIAEHITEGRISEMKYGSSPLGVLYLPTFTGDLITCFVEKDRGTYGWSINDTEGTILSVTVLREFGVDVPWIAVLRQGQLYIERIGQQQIHFSDSHLVVNELVPTNTFLGFDHLIGYTVQVVADGAVHPDVVVAGDGSITLQKEALEVVAGLAFTPEIESLPAQNNFEGGNTLSHEKRYSKIVVGLKNSPRPIVNDQDTYRRNPSTEMGTREESRTELVEVTNKGWSKESLINVKQPLPIDMRISCIGGKLRENKL